MSLAVRGVTQVTEKSSLQTLRDRLTLRTEVCELYQTVIHKSVQIKLVMSVISFPPPHSSMTTTTNRVGGSISPAVSPSVVLHCFCMSLSVYVSHFLLD